MFPRCLKGKVLSLERSSHDPHHHRLACRYNFIHDSGGDCRGLDGDMRLFVHIIFVSLIFSISLVSSPLDAGELNSGDKIKDCEECPELVVVPPGSFLMGGLNNGSMEPSREQPVHKVTIIYSFAVGKYEVTSAQWKACVDDGGCSNNTSPEVNKQNRANHPVVRVTWRDAKEFTSWLKQKTGKDYRLLSEAEWEYMARAGISTIFPWGNLPSNENARFDSDSTVPVGSYKPNSFGVYDVIGNVWEWVEDCWHSNYVDAPTNGKAWRKSGRHNCNRRVIRGGGYFYGSNIVRLSYRRSHSVVGSTERSDEQTGFRIARSIMP